MRMAQPVNGEVEIKPARLQFQGGEEQGTIYLRRRGGRILEAYRGVGYTRTPLAPILRHPPTAKEENGPT